MDDSSFTRGFFWSSPEAFGLPSAVAFGGFNFLGEYLLLVQPVAY